MLRLFLYSKIHVKYRKPIDMVGNIGQSSMVGCFVLRTAQPKHIVVDIDHLSGSLRRTSPGYFFGQYHFQIRLRHLFAPF